MDLSGYSHEAVIEALVVTMNDDSADDMIKASRGCYLKDMQIF